MKFLLLFLLSGVALAEPTDVLTVARDGIRFRYEAPSRIVAVGDLHADLNALNSILYARDLIRFAPKSWHWSGGSDHLVLPGDIVDRGEDSKGVLDFLYRLRSEARRSGGEIHLLEGNHEIMLLRGDVRYADPKDKEKFKETFPSMPAAFRQWDSPYARDLRNRNTILLLGDNVFVHAGTGAYLRPSSLEKAEEINFRIRDWIRHYQKTGRSNADVKTERLLGDRGPLWNRDLAEGKADQVEVDRDLEGLEAKRLFHGHTARKKIAKSYRGKVFNLDTGISSYYGGVLSAVEIFADGTVVEHNDIPRLQRHEAFRFGCPSIYHKVR